MKRRIYTDTSAIGGCLDDAFRDSSQQLFKRFKNGLDILVLSELTLKELQRAPDEVRAVVVDVDEQFIEEINFTEEASALAEKYIIAAVIGAAKRVDAQHIATAMVHRVDVLVSWNFRHIVNLNRIRGFNSVNLRNGYPMLEIRTPWEVLSYGEESEDD